ncbi:MAG: hypothetical protein U0840_00580 [Gemmataceae bacterium]
MRLSLMLLMLGLALVVAGSKPAKIASLPDREGWAGTFAGTSHGALLVAGGANFPGKKPWEGGKKVWYDSVFLLERPGGTWKQVGKLPGPRGYGVSVSDDRGVICVGGSDASRHHTSVFRLEWVGSKLETTPLPSLPHPLANACGALVKTTLYVAGGQVNPDDTTTSRAVYCLDLAAPKLQWKRIKSYPGSGRMLAVAASYDGAFWLVGGVDLQPTEAGAPKRRYLRDAYRHDPGRSWQRIAPLPWPVAAAPSPAPVDATGFVLLGGDDESQVGVEPASHRGFSKAMLRYETKTDRWVRIGELDAPRVTAPCVAWDGSWVVPSGEVRPGVRSPEVIRIPEPGPIPR